VFKITKTTPLTYYRTLQFYLKGRLFQAKLNDETTNLRKTEAGVPQGNALEPVLYIIYTNDLPTSDNTTSATFADDATILTTHEEPAIVSMKLQATINKINDWAKKGEN
jgi:hypothetical protein